MVTSCLFNIVVVYAAAVRRHVSFGSTTCCYYGTIHLEGTKKLVDVIERVGQRALVGKVNMDRNSPPELTETTAQSVMDTIDFVDYVLKKKNSTILPVLTPRFAPSCTAELMKQLGQLAKEKNLHIQRYAIHLCIQRLSINLHIQILAI